MDPQQRPRAEGDISQDQRYIDAKAIDAEMDQLWRSFETATAEFGEFDDVEAFDAWVDKVLDVQSKVQEMASSSDDLMDRQNDLVEELQEDYPNENIPLDGHSGLGEVSTIL